MRAADRLPLAATPYSISAPLPSYCEISKIRKVKPIETKYKTRLKSLSNFCNSAVLGLVTGMTQFASVFGFVYTQTDHRD